MLILNPNDNQGIRYVLAARLRRREKIGREPDLQLLAPVLEAFKKLSSIGS